MTENTKFIGYIGTYTNGESRGIYSFEFHTKEAKITNVREAAHLENPTYLNISKDKKFLYSVIKKGEEGGVAAFSIDSNSFELKLLNSQMAPGSSPCHVSMDSQNQYLFSANYHKGTVDSYLLDKETGWISEPVSIMNHEGSGPDPRQEKPHTHYAGVTPNEKFLAVVELGADRVLTYEVSENGELTEVSRLNTQPGSGPRHLVFHPNGKFAYVMTEFSSEVLTLAFNYENGSFTQTQAISTLPADFTENNQGSAIHITSDGKFVYAGNRGHNSIAVFSVNSDNGQLQLVERVSTEGDWPRDFVIDPTEAFIIAANQNSSNLVIYSRDIETGKLTLLQSDITVPNPVCVKFL
ncbi:lactonase family protein [Neobacillus sp. D3-1R]|uniref:lactonase family protein n=1 Tax=Neobacillus sp. D3-1R TaxID=3445778 RepID=UPI003F9F57C4